VIVIVARQTHTPGNRRPQSPRCTGTAAWRLRNLIRRTVAGTVSLVAEGTQECSRISLFPLQTQTIPAMVKQGFFFAYYEYFLRILKIFHSSDEKL
jgi:hypothetical protein